MGKPEVGETLYSLNVGNAARGREQILTPVIVTKVGRKYFSTAEEKHQGSELWNTQYYLDDWSEKSEYSAHSALYRNPEDWEREKEAHELTEKLRKYFDWRGRYKEISLEQLRTIALIIWADENV